jgi:hypothetical protein
MGFYSKEYIVKINYDENVPLEEYLWRFSIEITIVIKNERTICCVCQYEKHFCMFKRNTCTLIKGCNIQLWPKWKINNHNYHIEKGFFPMPEGQRGNNTFKIWQLWIFTFHEGHNDIVILRHAKKIINQL